MSGPTFYNAAGNPITASSCGTPYTFDVPGYPSVWLTQAKNGVKGYDGPFDLPMAPYSADCSREIGVYLNDVYELVNGAKGAYIGSASFTVTAPSGSPPPSSNPQSTTNNNGQPGNNPGGACSAGSCTSPTTPSGGGSSSGAGAGTGGGPGPVSTGGASPSPNGGSMTGVPAGSTAATPATTHAGSTFNVIAFLKGPYGIALIVLLVVLLILTRKGG